ncbi:MAG: hypothetical protein JWO31_2465 [Phycisphaerales bacterium]|nr:hypothetical protein [Phycisphaerales bacterium]
MVLPNGFYVDPFPTLVTFRCDGVDDNELGGFNFQNVLNGLHFERLDPLVQVEFSAIHGVGGRVTCYQVSVVDVVALNGQGEPAGAV